MRLLGLDPFPVQAVLARLAPGVNGVVAEASAAASGPLRGKCEPVPVAGIN